jgi:hypothetical protein
MAWIKMKNSVGQVLDLPEPVYENFFKGKEGFTLVQESKPAPIKKEKEDVVENEQVQEPIKNEGSGTRKSTKKATV